MFPTRFVEMGIPLVNITGRGGNKMEILIVDDEPQVAEVLAKSLNRQGHRTTVVHSGAEALDRLRTPAPDATFLDVSTPGMNRLEAMQAVQPPKPALAGARITGPCTAH